MRRFYSPQPLTTSPITLEGQVVRHMIQVLRMQPGDELELFDGQASFKARLLEANRKHASLELLEQLSEQQPSPLHTHLGQAISKGDRMDWVIQKATELGVKAITPLYTLQGDVKLKGEREVKKLNHWQQIALSACEQCGRTDVPEIFPPQALTTWLQERDEDLKLTLHPGSHQAALAEKQVGSVALLIGPEGGLSESEVSRAAEQGFLPLSLGPRVLRTETAPVVALSLFQHWWGDY